MKSIKEIEKLSVEELERIGADESIPVPGDLSVKLPSAKVPVVILSTAAAAAIVAGVFIGIDRANTPADTFDDPYLAYAAVENALCKISGSVNSASVKLEDAESTFNKLNYWK
ncbi:MAG: hypothetical protein IK052_06750 [Bacteroidales bacterium]|nr:hypothetical protein [Bacteroidales bacterium]